MQGSDFVSLCVHKKPKTIAAFIKAFDRSEAICVSK